ncbi:hypothetical protein [Streptomyces sp. NPDC001502]|uniref:hypothetical protein n=1 Tax=Streptomyces sp. NPDC001502 TaxID=3364578 RepID=UPI00367BDFD1
MKIAIYSWSTRRPPPLAHHRSQLIRANTLRGAGAVAVHGERVAFYGGYGGYGAERDRLAHGELTETSVEPTEIGLLTPPDGTPPGHRRAVARGSRSYVQAEPFTAWGVFDLSR